MREHFISNPDSNNAGVSIHAIELNPDAAGTPLVIVPGMINSAEEVVEPIAPFLKRRTIVLSVRGRGKSDSPARGYTLIDQASDVAAVVNGLKLTDFYLLGHSVGATFAVQSLAKHKDRVRAIVIGDFAPFYPPFSEAWKEQVLQSEDLFITDAALDGIVRDAAYADVSQHLRDFGKPILAIKPEGKDALLRDEDLARLDAMLDKFTVRRLPGAGHMFFEEAPEMAVSTVEEFFRELEA